MASFYFTWESKSVVKNSEIIVVMNDHITVIKNIHYVVISDTFHCRQFDTIKTENKELYNDAMFYLGLRVVWLEGRL